MKRLIIFLFTILFFSACVKQSFKESPSETIIDPETQQPIPAASKNTNSITICHHLPNGSWELKNIGVAAWPSHQAHGDVRLDDEDNDGYVPNNACGYGVQGDCNDTNAFIHPGVAEICNGIDDNCNGIIDENCFPAVIIGNQVWMTKNLEVTTYRNGDPISSSWGNPFGAWSYYGNDPANGLVYGKLYNGFAVLDPRGLAPAGWHVPSVYEVHTLLRYLDPATDTTNTASTPSFIAGGPMKETGTIHWLSPNGAATNASGFTALPGGSRDDEGTPSNLGSYGFWWTSSGHIDIGNPQGGGSPGSAREFYINYGDGSVVVGGREVMWGFSVRCVRD